MGLLIDENLTNSELRAKKKKKKERRKALSPILQTSYHSLAESYPQSTSKVKKHVKINAVSSEDEQTEKRHPLNDLINLSDPSDEERSPTKPKKRHSKSSKPKDYLSEEEEAPLVPLLENEGETYPGSSSKKKKQVKINVVNEEDENETEKMHPLNDLINLSDDPSSDEEKISPTKQKKRHSKSSKPKDYSSEEEDLHIPIVEIEEDAPDEINMVEEEPEENKVLQDFYTGWTKEDLQKLFERMSESIPKNDTLKYNSRVPKLNWEKISFGSHSAQDCLEKWKVIEKKLRGYRILSELINDASSWLEKPWTAFYQSVRKNRHPNMPKRPLTSYMLFYMDKKKKFSKKYPNLEVSKLSKIMAEKFKNLPEHKKEKYNRLAASTREEYNEKMKKFYEDHPEENKKKKKLGQKTSAARSGPKKPLPPFKIFLQDKLKQLEGIKTQTDTQTIIQECKNKWNSMSSKKKIPWIRWAHEAETKYLEEIKLYRAENPNFEAVPYKSVLSKKEKEILERMEGKPEKPPNSAYSLFSRLMLKDPELKNKFETPKERLQEIAKLWKEVPKIQKEEYAEKVKQLLENYKLEYATYLESLPEDKRNEELASNLPRRKAKRDVGPNKKLKQTTINAFKKLCPEGDEPNKKPKSLEELIKMEPVHPPEDPFVLFKDEYLTKGLSEKRAIKAWKSLSDIEKRKYEKKIENLKQEYITNFRTFLTSLKPDELNTYSAYKGKMIKEAVNKDSEEEDSEDDDSSKSSESSEDEEEDAHSDES